MGRHSVSDFSKITDGLLALPGITLGYVRVWNFVWQQTLGRPNWDLSYRQIAEGAGVSRTTAIKAVAFFVRYGYMTKQSRSDSAGDDAPNLVRCFLATQGVVARTTPPSRADDTRGSSADDTTGSSARDTHQENHYRENHYREKRGAGAPDAAEPAAFRPVTNSVVDGARVKAQSASTAKSKTGPLPDDWDVGRELVAWTSERLSHRYGNDNDAYELLLEKFRTHHRAAGTRRADWNEAWKSWVLNEVGYGRQRERENKARERQARGFLT
jgi:hypothetical protein